MSPGAAPKFHSPNHNLSGLKKSKRAQKDGSVSTSSKSQGFERTPSPPKPGVPTPSSFTPAPSSSRQHPPQELDSTKRKETKTSKPPVVLDEDHISAARNHDTQSNSRDTQGESSVSQKPSRNEGALEPTSRPGNTKKHTGKSDSSHQEQRRAPGHNQKRPEGDPSNGAPSKVSNPAGSSSGDAQLSKPVARSTNGFVNKELPVPAAAPAPPLSTTKDRMKDSAKRISENGRPFSSPQGSGQRPHIPAMSTMSNPTHTIPIKTFDPPQGEMIPTSDSQANQKRRAETTVGPTLDDRQPEINGNSKKLSASVGIEATVPSARPGRSTRNPEYTSNSDDQPQTLESNWKNASPPIHYLSSPQKPPVKNHEPQPHSRVASESNLNQERSSYVTTKVVERKRGNDTPLKELPENITNHTAESTSSLQRKPSEKPTKPNLKDSTTGGSEVPHGRPNKSHVRGHSDASKNIEPSRIIPESSSPHSKARPNGPQSRAAPMMNPLRNLEDGFASGSSCSNHSARVEHGSPNYQIEDRISPSETIYPPVEANLTRRRQIDERMSNGQSLDGKEQLYREPRTTPITRQNTSQSNIRLKDSNEVTEAIWAAISPYYQTAEIYWQRVTHKTSHGQHETWRYEKVLGQGGSGEVTLEKCDDGWRTRAVKKVFKSSPGIEFCVREIYAMAALNRVGIELSIFVGKVTISNIVHSTRNTLSRYTGGMKITCMFT